MPSHTYVDRAGRELEPRLLKATRNLCKLVTLTGSTKSGKTVLTKRVYPRAIGEAVWVDGGSVRAEEDLWMIVLDELDGSTSFEETSSSELGGEVGSGVEGGIAIPFVGGLKAKGDGKVTKKLGTGTRRELSLSPRAAAIGQLRAAGKPLIIDDFHYIDRDFQGDIIRALKPLIFDGMAVIVIAIPHRRYDAVRVEREMTGRLDPVSVPPWSREELLEIPVAGFPLLNISVPVWITERMANEAYGSPHLMQEFCREYAEQLGVEYTATEEVIAETFSDDLFHAVAEQTGKVIFDKLAQGPRQRTDRLQRELAAGGSADIYKVVLLALARLSPGLERVEYEALRASIRDVLAENIPEAHEVSRVLEKMSEIASSDEASTPVLDWDKEDRLLHITDPFFAFFLKWGVIGPD